ncbi:Transcriptional regulator, TetR family [Roseomonas mucosa]|jgi:AcrR family transcriptional regulator|uniref:TetR family transcriptional regulator n=2 Tax=Roseomonas TaxID=125216 RepID=A0A1S8D247_9PROT|nr:MULTISPECIES: TetR/AcrR family transcriptional regulator [Roseomonas]ATR21338.1 TetR/AcrR family transcriptional regulator [Roseomonas sp. FDAARGOS_362]AWV22064.1 Transcriptional regulator, TetR family [Roseomonas mucosa]MDT8275179.1 TetR family transcriptional regulator [Roseomonas mucosa]MDT8330879.1 TetR family transcriptional regulator [Roseomonas gilardii]MDT8355636.1 TetR family transcriptional regulator [Roseomonas mucosa]
MSDILIPQRSKRAETTRRKILDAAVVEFTANGLAGARVDEIAARAGVNKRMLYVHFGSKEELWIQVLEHVYGAKREEERALDVGSLPPVEAMARLVRFNLRYTARHPEFVTLLNQENMHRASYLGRSEQVRALYSPLLESVRDVLVRGAEAGVFRRDADPLQTYVTIVAVGHFYVANLHTLSAIFKTDLSTEVALGLREDHCVDVILGYLRA